MRNVCLFLCAYFSIQFTVCSSIQVFFEVSNPVSPFIGRIGHLNKIHWSHTDRKIAVIIGNQGVGKTELSRKYCEGIKDENSSSIIWIDSHSEVEVITNLKKLSLQIGIIYSDKSIPSHMRQIMRFFGKESTLFVFDGAKPDNVLINNIYRFVSNKRAISVIITSRQDNWRNPLFKLIRLGSFSRLESIDYIQEMLLKHMNTTTSERSAEELAQILQDKPSSLNEAIAYIVKQNRMNPVREYTVEDYIDFKTEVKHDDRDIEIALLRKSAKKFNKPH